MFCIIANAGTLRLPLALVIVVLMAAGFYTDQQEETERQIKRSKFIFLQFTESWE